MILRKWAAKEKMAIALERLRGQKSVAEICRDHKVRHWIYFFGRVRFLGGGEEV